MDQYQIVDNLINLCSDDDELRLEALLSKKEWILDKFYVPYSLNPATEGEYCDLHALKNLALPFHKLVEHGIQNAKNVELIETFNKKFRWVRLYQCLPERTKKHIFYAEVDFRKLDKADYKVLLPYFFYALTPKVLKEISFPKKKQRVLAMAIQGEEDEVIQIIEKRHLDKNILKVDCITKIYAYDDLNKEELGSIKEISRFLRKPLVTVRVGRK